MAKLNAYTDCETLKNDKKNIKRIKRLSDL